MRGVQVLLYTPFLLPRRDTKLADPKPLATVTARIPIPPYAPYFLVFVPILLIDLRDCALMRYDIVEGFCSYLCSRACEVV
jgi:hypothetical protein